MQSAASGEASQPQPQEPVKQPVRPAAAPERKEWKEPRERRGSGLFGVNRWVLAFAVLALCAAGAIYFWSEGGTSQQSSVTVAQQIGLENSGLDEYVGKAKASGETFYGVVQPSWDTLSEQQRKDVLQKAQTFAASKGLRKVDLLNAKGRTVGFASGTRLDILNP
jgi:hypothetical protein